jgi:hypothetical protein
VGDVEDGETPGVVRSGLIVIGVPSPEGARLWGFQNNKRKTGKTGEDVGDWEDAEDV